MPSYSVQHVMVDVVVFEGNNIEVAKIAKIAVFPRLGLGVELLLSSILIESPYFLLQMNRVDLEQRGCYRVRVFVEVDSGRLLYRVRPQLRKTARRHSQQDSKLSTCHSLSL